MEYFDIVDGQDRPTGELTTSDVAHRDGILHRLVAVYVFDREGKLLVQLHKKSKFLDHSVGGHVTAGEEYTAAAQRESDEELGLAGQKLTKLVGSLYSDEMFDGVAQIGRYYHMFGIYECYVSADWQFIPNDEVDRIIPMDLADVVKMMSETPGKFTPGFINTMAKYLEIKQLPHKLDLPKVRKNWGKTYATKP